MHVTAELAKLRKEFRCSQTEKISHYLPLNTTKGQT